MWSTEVRWGYNLQFVEGLRGRESAGKHVFLLLRGAATSASVDGRLGAFKAGDSSGLFEYADKNKSFQENDVPAP